MLWNYPKLKKKMKLNKCLLAAMENNLYKLKKEWP